MTICIAGKNAIAVEALIYVLAQRLEGTKLIACINKNDNGENSWQPSFLFACQKYQIEVVSLEACYEIEDLYFFSLEYDRLIKTGKFKTKNLFNIHFSLLPAYKGMYTSVFPLLHGEQYAGVTFHKIDDGIDTGPIIDQIKFELTDSTTSRELYDLYLAHSFDLFKRNFAKVINGDFIAIAQEAERSTYFSSKTLNFSRIDIDLNKTAWQVHNQIRAFTFRDYQLPQIFGNHVYLSIILDVPTGGKPGTLASETDSFFDVNTVDYQIRIFKDRAEELFNAAKEGNLKLVKNIYSSGYDITVKNKIGWDVLIIACYHEHFELVEWLLNNNFNVNTTNYKGTSAIMYAMTAASKSSNLQIMELLLANDAKLSLKDDKGLDVFDYSINYNNPLVIENLNKLK